MSVEEARELAVLAHGEQRDRDGSLHIDHVARVAAGAASSDAVQRVAWLHDVIEDTAVGVDDLRRRVSDSEVDALMLLTHDDPDESYDDYISRLLAAEGEAGELARAVKESDMLDNLRRCAAGRDPAISQYGRSLARLWAR